MWSLLLEFFLAFVGFGFWSWGMLTPDNDKAITRFITSIFCYSGSIALMGARWPGLL